MSGMMHRQNGESDGKHRRFYSNEGGFTPVRSDMKGSALTIYAADPECRDDVLQVIGERCDKHMKDTNWTDDNGRVIVEPHKPPNKKE
jgi:hypothetical protein